MYNYYNRHHHKMTAVYYSSREVWSLHSLSAFTSTSRFTDPDIEEAGEGVCFAHPSTLGLVWVRKKGVGVCPIIVNIVVTCMTYFFSWTRLQIITSISCTNVCHSDYFPYFLNRIHVQCMLVSLNSSTFLSRYSVNFCMLTTDVSDKFVPIYVTTVYTSSTCIWL